MDDKTRYIIYRDGRVFGSFVEGDPARGMNRRINHQTMLHEFRDCKNHWNAKVPRNQYQWELRIIEPRRKPRVTPF